MKFGFDIHGVLDTYPAIREMAKALKAAGHEIHIITGKRLSLVLDELRDLDFEPGRDYDRLFSITNYHESIGSEISWDEKGSPHMDSVLWDKTKADYCRREGIDFHIDDSNAYLPYFTTPVARMTHWDQVWRKDKKNV